MARTGRISEELLEGAGCPEGPLSMEMRKTSITEQVRTGIAFLCRRYRAERFILYLQSYSNTFAPLAELKEIYDHALSQEEFTEFIIATRPDCITEANADLIASYRGGSLQDVWVELGLQSGNDETLGLIRRGHTVGECSTAVSILRARGIKVSLHVILGLPGEGYDQVSRTAEVVREIHPDAVKIHNLHIPIRTRMYRQYLAGEFCPPSVKRHLSNTIFFLERIPDDIIIGRVVCDTPAHRLAAPLRFGAKGSFVQQLEAEMSRRKTCQGIHTGSTIQC